ncbi:methionyl-tRNA formyltransferase [Polynucleobacter sp. MWH-Mekk-B1]|uniref:methionyl-tRNA formyltransferase n=1 Tax=Polynucleobacter finlandensis TaxID=1855894 RepID=UPI001C0C6016|nr:methionyl-tRNA formyltransferase [Polynucleobacter finlandensis]MBU3545295.1 methionyl-tRNA formyltransferase [Polynucleobacter finlandensis]
MKIVFAGTPEFAAQAMRAIDAAGHQIVLVLTQPDRRSGRGMHVQASPVKTFALEKNIPLLQPASLRRNSADPEKQAEAEAAYQQLSTTDFDVMVVVAYGLILPQDVLDIAESNLRHGCFNIHASILPRWRGAAPIQRSIEHGDSKTGVSIMKMDVGLDTGDTVLVREIAIADNETSASLHDRLAKLGAESIVEALSTLQQGASLIKTPQAAEGIRYAEKILKSEAEIDWQLSATEIDHRIRAFNPFPGATSNLDGIPMKFWNSRVSHSGGYSQTGQIGEVLGFSKEGAFIQCGQGVIEVLEMQKPGGKRMNAVAYLRTHGAPSKALRFHKE